MNYEIRSIAGVVRKNLDLELRALRSRDAWASITAVWPLLDQVLARWVAFVTPSMPMPEGNDTVLRNTIRVCVDRARNLRTAAGTSVAAGEADYQLYTTIFAVFVGMAPLLSRVTANVESGKLWSPLDGPLGLFNRLSVPTTYVWASEPVLDVELVRELLIDALTDDITRPLTQALMERIKEAA